MIFFFFHLYLSVFFFSDELILGLCDFSVYICYCVMALGRQVGSDGMDMDTMIPIISMG